MTDEAGVEPLPQSLVVLRELLAAGDVDPRTVAALFDGELSEITEQLEALRDDPPADLDVAEIIAALRGALQFLAVRKSREMWDRRRRPPARRRTSDQPPLLSAQDLGEQALDLGAES